MYDLPLVSVIIPVYNMEKYIYECMKSVLNQTYKNIEIIVVDDGSNDQTPEIIKEFKNRVIIVKQINNGAASAINHGIRLAKGDYIAWLAADDVYLEDFIRCQVELFLSDNTLGAVYTDFQIIDASGQLIKIMQSIELPPEQFTKRILEGNFINGSTVCVRQECYDTVGHYDENLQASCDTDMWIRLAAHGYKFGHIPVPLVKYRWHPANTSHDFRLMQKNTDIVHCKGLKLFLKHGFTFSEKEFEHLSIELAKRYCFKAACNAAREALRKRFSLKKLVLWLLLNMLNNRLFITMLSSDYYLTGPRTFLRIPIRPYKIHEIKKS